MANEKRNLIDRDELIDSLGISDMEIFAKEVIGDAPTVDAYTEEQVANIIQLSHQLHATNVELEKECAWLKSCLNCKIRKECPRHCGKVVHGCDHWEHGDSTVDAVEVVHGRWKIEINEPNYKLAVCSVCLNNTEFISNYCPNCGAKMDLE